MKDNFDTSLQLVLVHEGGFSDHPSDPGGATMKGVTLTTFQSYYGNEQGVTNLKNITQEQLSNIYRSGYWNKCQGDALPKGVDYAVFDLAVNSGPGRAAKFLQTAVGAQADGAIGEQTLAKVAAASAEAIIKSVCEQRLAFLRSLKTFDTFGTGWTKRVNDVQQQALVMAGGTGGTSGTSGTSVGSASTASDSSVPNTNFAIVKLNSQGEWVVKLQAALGITQDGIFGPQTEASLKAYQTEHGLVADGIAGRNTYRALGLIA